MSDRPNAAVRLFRGETSFDFTGRWTRWFALSGVIILAGSMKGGLSACHIVPGESRKEIRVPMLVSWTAWRSCPTTACSATAACR